MKSTPFLNHLNVELMNLKRSEVSLFAFTWPPTNVFSCSSSTTESVYDLLPKELQLQPSSTQTDPPTMSQKSGGEAGSPPATAVASGERPAQSMKSVTRDQFLPSKLFPPNTRGGEHKSASLSMSCGQLQPFTSS